MYYCGWICRSSVIGNFCTGTGTGTAKSTVQPCCTNDKDLNTVHFIISTAAAYNLRTKRIFPVRCGGFDHEYYTFWKEFDRERKARARKSPSSTNFISDTPSIRDSLSLSGGTDEALHPSDPSRPTPEVNGLAAGAKSNPPTPMLFSIGSAQACSTFSVSAEKTKRHRYFTRSSRRNNEG